MREISKMADSICPALKTTFDCPGMQEEGKMTVLDLQQWVDWVLKEEGEGVTGKSSGNSTESPVLLGL